MSKSNPFTQSEYELCKSITSFLELQYPNVLFHWDYGSGVKMSIGSARKMKYLNTRRGHPDLVIYEPTERYNGLFIEIKTLENEPFTKRGNLVSDKHIQEQGQFLNNLNERGYYAIFGIGSEHCCEIIKTYMVQAKAYQLKMEIKRKLPKNVMGELIEAQSDYNDAMIVAFFEAEKSAGNIKEITKKTKNSKYF